MCKCLDYVRTLFSQCIIAISNDNDIENDNNNNNNWRPSKNTETLSNFRDCSKEVTFEKKSIYKWHIIVQFIWHTKECYNSLIINVNIIK